MQPETTTTIQVPDSAPLVQMGVEVRDRALALVVTNDGEYDFAGQELRRVAVVIYNIKAAFKEPKARAHEAHRAITKLEGDLLEIPQKAERRIKEVMGGFVTEQDRIRREEQQRLQAEETRKADEAKLREALAAEAAGDHEAASQIIEAPTVAPVIELEKPRAAGISARKKYRFHIIDPTKIDRKFLIPDESKIRGVVDRMGMDAVGLVGGIQVYADTVISARR